MNTLIRQLGLSHKPNVGISQCLMGDKVRYDGDDKYHPASRSWLPALFELHPFCPEMSIGLTAPRPPIKLVSNEHGTIRVIEPKAQTDYTEALANSAKKCQQAQTLSGFILTTKSPSCGLESTKLHDPQGAIIGLSSGMFAQHLNPELALIEDRELEHEQAVQAFIEKAYCRHYQMSRDYNTGKPLASRQVVLNIQQWLRHHLQTLLNMP